MKKSTISLLIAATSFVLLGLVVFAFVMAALDWDFNKLNTDPFKTNTYEISEEFKNISINTDTADIFIIPSEGESCKVVCYEQEKMKHSVAIQDDTLTIKVVNSRKLIDYIGFSYSFPKITVYLPEEHYASLQIDTDTGNVEVPDNFSFEEIRVTDDTGDIKCRASASGLIKIETVTGDINVDGISAGELNLYLSTGEVNVTSVTCEGNVSVDVDTSDVKLTDITCKSVASNGSTGYIKMKNVIAFETFTVMRDTGKVIFDGCDAADISVRINTGDVTGTLLTEKVFITETDTGDIDVPKTVTGGRCEIITETGNIKIEIMK